MRIHIRPVHVFNIDFQQTALFQSVCCNWCQSYSLNILQLIYHLATPLTAFNHDQWTDRWKSENFAGVSWHASGEWAGSGSEGAAARRAGANRPGCVHPAPTPCFRAAVAQGQQVAADAEHKSYVLKSGCDYTFCFENDSLTA